MSPVIACRYTLLILTAIYLANAESHLSSRGFVQAVLRIDGQSRFLIGAHASQDVVELDTEAAWSGMQQGQTLRGDAVVDVWVKNID